MAVSEGTLNWHVPTCGDQRNAVHFGKLLKKDVRFSRPLVAWRPGKAISAVAAVRHKGGCGRIWQDKLLCHCIC
jgi:hypothetical protein